MFFARNTANEEPREQAAETLDQTDQRKKKKQNESGPSRARCMCNFYVTKYVPAHISQLTTHARAQDDYYHILRSNKHAWIHTRRYILVHEARWERARGAEEG